MRICKHCKTPVGKVASQTSLEKDYGPLDFCKMCDSVVEGQTEFVPDEYESPTCLLEDDI